MKKIATYTQLYSILMSVVIGGVLTLTAIIYAYTYNYGIKPWYVLSLGGGIALFLIYLFFLLHQIIRRIRRIVSKQTKELEARNNHLKLFIKHTPAAVAMFDKDLRYLHASNRWIHDYKLEKIDIIGKKHYEIFPEILSMPTWLDIHQRALKGERFSVTEDVFTRSDFSEEWLRWAIHPWYDSHDEVGGIIMFTEVITDEKINAYKLQTLTNVSLATENTASLDELLETIVEEISLSLACSVGHVYQFDPGRNCLNSTNQWWFEDDDNETLKKDLYDLGHSIQRLDQTKLIANSLKTGKVGYINMIDKQEDCDICKVCRQYHIESILAFPLDITKQTKFVLLFFMQRPLGGRSTSFYQSLLKPITKIVENKKIKFELEASNRLNQAVLDSTNHLIIATDANGTILHFNKASQQALGYSENEVVKKETPALWHDLDEVVARTNLINDTYGVSIQPGFETFVHVAKIKGFDQHEWTFIRKDKTRFPVTLNVTPLKNKAGDSVGFLGTIEDITVKKVQEKALRISEETFRSAMQHAPSGIALVNPDGSFLKVNKKLCDLLGYSKKELVAKNFQSITHADDLELDLGLVRKTITGEMNHYKIEKRYVHKLGHSFWALLSVSLVRNEDNSPKYFISQIQDISEQKAMDTMKNEFVSVVSHELRTPIASIRGSLGLIAGVMHDKIPEKAISLIQIALKNCERLILIINDILDMEKLVSGKMSINFTTLDIIPLIQQSMAENQSFADKYHVHLDFSTNLNQALVMVDGDRFIQVMTNLISNAVKFSPENSDVIIQAHRKNHCIKIGVSDNGPGIKPEFQQKIFTKFSQADSSSTREKGGTGLGLYISKQIIHQLNGKIDFETEEGVGTTFWLSLPIVEQEVQRQSQG